MSQALQMVKLSTKALSLIEEGRPREERQPMPVNVSQEEEANEPPKTAHDTSANSTVNTKSTGFQALRLCHFFKDWAHPSQSNR
jgi:hypothetical protein